MARTINEIVFTMARAVLLVGEAALLLGFRFHGDSLNALGGLAMPVVLTGAMTARSAGSATAFADPTSCSSPG